MAIGRVMDMTKLTATIMDKIKEAMRKVYSLSATITITKTNQIMVIIIKTKGGMAIIAITITTIITINAIFP